MSPKQQISTSSQRTHAFCRRMSADEHAAPAVAPTRGQTTNLVKRGAADRAETSPEVGAEPPAKRAKVGNSCSTSASATTTTTTTVAAAAAAEITPTSETGTTRTGVDNADFVRELYTGLAIHETMLADVPRTEAYRAAIAANAGAEFAGKTVIDLGAGTGVLSCFAAAAGARRVYAIEATAVAEAAAAVVAANGFADVVTVVNAFVEDLEGLSGEVGDDADGAGHHGTSPPAAKADVIVSEWMGLFLLYEAMLRSVISARDRFLAPGGRMYPSHAAMYLAPLTDPEADEGFNFWNGDHYGLDLSVLRPIARREAFANATNAIISPHHLLAEPATLISLDLATVAADDLDFVSGPWIRRAGGAGLLLCAPTAQWLCPPLYDF